MSRFTSILEDSEGLPSLGKKENKTSDKNKYNRDWYKENKAKISAQRKEQYQKRKQKQNASKGH